MTKEEIIKNLKYTMEKHENDTVDTFGTNISVMCKDILGYLEQDSKSTREDPILESYRGKIFENENDGMMMEFATGIKEYCRNNENCEKCIFNVNDEAASFYPPLWCRVNYPMNWRV